MTAGAMTLCIVNYQGARYLPKALAAAKACSAQFAEILIVDNASTDDSVVWLRREWPDVRVIELERNRGPAAARNVGFAAARFDLILFQDNDVRLQHQCPSILASVLTTSAHALAAAPRVLYASDASVVQYDSADCHFLGLMTTRNADRPVVDVPAQTATTTSLVTASFLIDRSRWRGGVLFDEWFGFNYEDHDFGVRANVQGFEVLCVASAEVLHDGGTAGLSYRPGGVVPAARMFYLIRNRWAVMTKSFALRSLLLLAPILLSYEVFQLIGAASRGWLAQWTAALRSWWLELPRLARERRDIQESRRTPDRLVLKSGPLPLTGAVRAGRTGRLALKMFQTVANAYWRVVRPLL